MASTVPTASTAAGGYEEKPGFLKIAWAVFLGYVAALVFAGAAALALLFLGIVGTSGTAGVDPDGLLGWPYWRTGWWSALANATVNLGIVAVAAVCVRSAVADRTGRYVRLSAVAATLLVTGYVPLAAFDGALQLSGVIALLATALLVRWFGVDGTERRPVLPVRRPAAIAAAALSAAALAATAGYGLTHPLWFGSAVWDNTPEGRIGGQQVFRHTFEEGKGVAYWFSLTNAGFADARVVAIEAPSTNLLHLTGFRPDEDLSGRASSAAGAAQFVVPGRSQRWVMLGFRLSGCGVHGSEGADVVTHVTVRYRVLGSTQSQYVPLKPAPGTRCP
ncbi:MAG: hypothetical protein ACRDOS_03120 [Gaiellaceae bacterium]